ncbi:MAG: hypothetical protein ACTTHU_06505 [Treponema sp.]
MLQGNFCTYALPRIVNPAQVILPSFALSPFFCFVSRSPPSLNCAPVLQGNFCIHALPRIVNPAQVTLPPAASSPSIQLSSIIKNGFCGLAVFLPAHSNKHQSTVNFFR